MFELKILIVPVKILIYLKSYMKMINKVNLMPVICLNLLVIINIY